MKYILFSDELGESTPKRHKTSKYFLVTGCLVDKTRTLDISNGLDHIKYKYWNKTDIIFHSKDIGVKAGYFSIFKKQVALFNDFVSNMQKFFQDIPISIIGVIVDQESAFRSNWSQKTVIKTTYGKLFENFIRILVARNCQGEFIQEASTTLQDLTIYEKFWYYQTLGIPTEKIPHSQVKDKLTSISFVTKKNMDSLTQITDLLGYGLLLEYQIRKKYLKINALNKYQLMIRKIAKSKLVHLPDNMNNQTKSKYKNFSELVSLPQ